MLYYWCAYALGPIVLLDMLWRLSPFYAGAWPVGLEQLSRGRYFSATTTIPL